MWVRSSSAKARELTSWDERHLEAHLATTLHAAGLAHFHLRMQRVIHRWEVLGSLAHLETLRALSVYHGAGVRTQAPHVLKQCWRRRPLGNAWRAARPSPAVWSPYPLVAARIMSTELWSSGSTTTSITAVLSWWTCCAVWKLNLARSRRTAS